MQLQLQLQGKNPQMKRSFDSILKESASSTARLSRPEKMVVFDFDGTLYMHNNYRGAKISCYIDAVPIFLLSDLLFLEKLVQGLHARGIPMGVASFGKKSIIIDTMNQLLYGPTRAPPTGGDPYFGQHNVITVPDVKEHWKKSLQQISRTFKSYVDQAGGNVDAGFEAFLAREQPQRTAKYYCMALDPISKVEMIDMIREYYNKKDGMDIKREDVRFFDDNGDNVNTALAHGIMAHQVPQRKGLTFDWWQRECQLGCDSVISEICMKDACVANDSDDDDANF